MATYFKKRNQWREILPLPGGQRCSKWFGSEEEANAYRDKYFKETPWLVKLNNFIDGKPAREATDSNIDRRLSSGWLRMSQLPIGSTLTRRLIDEGFLDSIVVASPGSKRGVRLVSQESLDRYFRSLLPTKKVEAITITIEASPDVLINVVRKDIVK